MSDTTSSNPHRPTHRAVYPIVGDAGDKHSEIVVLYDSVYPVATAPSDVDLSVGALLNERWPHIGKPKRDRARTKMAKESRRRNRQ